MRSMLRRLAICESGATAIEYGLIMIIVLMAVLGGATMIGPKLNEYLLNSSARLSE